MTDQPIILAIAAFVDYLIGDPWGWPHPVQAIGWLIDRLFQFSIKTLNLWLKSGDKHFTRTEIVTHRLSGVVLGIVIVTSTGGCGWLMVETARWLHPLLGVVISSILLASCFAGKSLTKASEEVLQPLIEGDLATARIILSNYVGRDTENLSKAEILRAVLETVTENATDGVMAPLFYAIAGSFIPEIGCVPLALAYKAASTLDSMVGYKQLPFTHIGWFSAKLEDVLTWLPCRLTVLICLALVSAGCDR
jgi:adenosylcobinamide-phosphate synthase